MTANPEVNTLAAQIARDVFFVPHIHLIQLGRGGIGHTTAFERLKATALFADSIVLNTWDHWISEQMVREVRHAPVREGGTLREILDEQAADRPSLPLVLIRNNEALPIHNELQLKRGDEIVFVEHEPHAGGIVQAYDRFDRLVESASVLDLKQQLSTESFFSLVASAVSETLNMTPETLKRLLLKREMEFSSLITPGLSVPHIIVDRPGQFHMVIARAQQGVVFPREQQTPHTLFVLVHSQEERTFHLRALSAIAQIVQDPDFEINWEKAEGSEDLRRLIRTAERHRYADAENFHIGR
jgi:mannitol/fructose-specific phosphotransferase system IIA component (Ntr-type)